MSEYTPMPSLPDNFAHESVQPVSEVPVAAPTAPPKTGRAGLSTLALVLVSFHWLGHSVASGLATLYWVTPVLDWSGGADGFFFTVMGVLGVLAFLLGLVYLALGAVALVRSRASGAGRARAGGAVALAFVYLIVMLDNLTFVLLSTINYSSSFLGQLGLNP